jgi:hypothetical protein
MFNVSVRKIVVSTVALAAPIAFSLGTSSEAWGGHHTTSWEKQTSTHAVKKTTVWEKQTNNASRATTVWEKQRTTVWE